jgi:hypothetical protein
VPVLALYADVVLVHSAPSTATEAVRLLAMAAQPLPVHGWWYAIVLQHALVSGIDDAAVVAVPERDYAVIETDPSYHPVPVLLASVTYWIISPHWRATVSSDNAAREAPMITTVE